MTDYNDGKWHGWNGGDCPVHPETLVECYGGINAGRLPLQSRAKFRQWAHSDEGHGIVAFRVVKEHKEPVSGWVREKYIQYDIPDSCDAHKFIHVREVL